ncbi:MAG: DUF624 domain-containing protein [Eubacterium sp.]|nr:DUF624 domain-containing protein [Eubacterium sp.]
MDDNKSVNTEEIEETAENIKEDAVDAEAAENETIDAGAAEAETTDGEEKTSDTEAADAAEPEEEKSSIALSILYSLGNFLLFNIIFVLSLVPVVTIGAALTAYYDIAFTKRIDRSRKDFSVGNYINKFKSYFKLSTSYFLCYLVVIGFLVAIAMLFSPVGPMPNTVLSAVFFVLSGLVFSILMYTFPIIAINSVSAENEVIAARRGRENEEIGAEEALSNYKLRFSNVEDKEADEDAEYFSNQNSVGNILLDSVYFAAKHFIRLVFILLMYLLPAGILYVFSFKMAAAVCFLLVIGIRMIMAINASLYYYSFFDYEEELIDDAEDKKEKQADDAADDAEAETAENAADGATESAADDTEAGTAENAADGATESIADEAEDETVDDASEGAADNSAEEATESTSGDVKGATIDTEAETSEGVTEAGADEKTEASIVEVAVDDVDYMEENGFDTAVEEAAESTGKAEKADVAESTGTAEKAEEAGSSDIAESDVKDEKAETEEDPDDDYEIELF